MKAYSACVLPILEYASTCWQPTSESMDSALEMVHHNAARFIANVYIKKGCFKKVSISKLMNELQMETLAERRTKARLCMAYKIINNEVILESNMLPKVSISNKQRQCNAPNIGIENQLIEPKPKLQITEKTFFLSVPKIWNQRVTKSQAKAPSVEAFRNHFKSKV